VWFVGQCFDEADTHNSESDKQLVQGKP